jgi:hypothetical protein
MIKEMANFYRWLYCMDFYKFCEYLGKPDDDCWCVEKYDYIKKNFGDFVCNNGDLAEKFYALFKEGKPNK